MSLPHEKSTVPWQCLQWKVREREEPDQLLYSQQTSPTIASAKKVITIFIILFSFFRRRAFLDDALSWNPDLWWERWCWCCVVVIFLASEWFLFVEISAFLSVCRLTLLAAKLQKSTDIRHVHPCFLLFRGNIHTVIFTVVSRAGYVKSLMSG